MTPAMSVMLALIRSSKTKIYCETTGDAESALQMFQPVADCLLTRQILKPPHSSTSTT